MHLLQKTAIRLLSFWLLLVVLLGLPLAALSSTLTNKETVIDIISSQEIYQRLRQAADELPIDQLGQEADSDQPSATSQQAFFDATSFEPLIDKYLDYEFYRRSTTNVVNGLYNWLDGQTAQPQFEIRITDNPAEFRQLFVDILTTRYQSFPLCPAGTPAELERAFDQECRLAGVPTGQVRQAILDELAKSDLDQFINKATITSDEFASNLNPEDSARSKRIFGLAHNLPWIILGLTAGLLALLALAVFDRSRILKSLGWRLLIPALILVISGLVVRLAGGPWLESVISGNIETSNRSFTELAVLVAQKFGIAISNRWLLYSLITVLVGTAAIIAQKLINQEPIHLLKRQHKPPPDMA